MKKSIKTLICAGACAASVAGIGGMIGYAANSTTTSAVTAEADAKSGEEHKAPEDDGSIMAKVSSVSGSSITVYEAEKPSGENMQKHDGQTPPEKPADTDDTEKKTPPAKPDGSEADAASDKQTPLEKPAEDQSKDASDRQTPPAKPADDKTTDNGERSEMKYSDDEKSYTVSSSVSVTKGMQHEEASLSDISEGSIVRIKLDGSKITSIDIMNE